MTLKGTKMSLKEFDRKKIKQQIKKEMLEIYYGKNIPKI